jgi:hypothetical protein
MVVYNNTIQKTLKPSKQDKKHFRGEVKTWCRNMRFLAKKGYVELSTPSTAELDFLKTLKEAF